MHTSIHPQSSKIKICASVKNVSHSVSSCYRHSAVHACYTGITKVLVNNYV